MGRAFLDLNWASTVVNTLLVAFFVLVAGGIFIGIYGARTLAKREVELGVMPATKEELKAEKEARKAAKAAKKSAK